MLTSQHAQSPINHIRFPGLGLLLQETIIISFENFVRIHRKYIAILSFISSVELYEKNTHLVLMKNGDKIRASQEGYKRLRGVFS